jgi:signal transduction histidine kinase
VRIKNDGTRTIPCTGLGFSMVETLAQLDGGEVSVQSEPNVGRRFAVTLGLKAGARN